MPANAFLKAPVFTTVVKMIDIRGSYVGNRQDANEAVDFFARGLIHAPFKTASLEDLPKVFELMGMLDQTPFRIQVLTNVYRAGKDRGTLRSQDTRVNVFQQPIHDQRSTEEKLENPLQQCWS